MKNGTSSATAGDWNGGDLPRRKGTSLELRQIRYFVAIYETGSVTKAAARVLVAQSALSQQLAHLEDDLGVRLFTRTPHGVFPTAFGRKFYEGSLDILHRLSDAVDSVRRLAENPNGVVTVGMPQAISMVLGLPLLQRVNARLPDVRLRFAEDLSVTLKEKLKEGRLDMAVLCDDGMSDGLASEPLVDQSLYIVTSGAKGSSAPVSLAEALTAPLVLPDRRDGLRIAVELAASSAGLSLPALSEVSSLTVLKKAVLEDMAATILPLPCVWHEVEHGLIRARRIADARARCKIALFTRDQALLDPAAASVFRLIVDTAGELCQNERWQGATACPVERDSASIQV
jgi:LysR family transcriptional regulator, nitrogen assimilation regulatory protein